MFLLVIYVALIDGFYKEGQLDEASWTLIDRLCKEGKLEEAMKLFHEMSSKNICPNLSHTVFLLMVSQGTKVG